ncbi:hypothetical protein FSARC_14336 [Fusarium sarcochroum]|uniref:Uncharacterized protein n=1 Tax=Fusarium sarcochroum TaxID=1208366 RepID=A0A8H4SU71_9HYPO|nr:hypothetical protein FSARC_14336 [Fusarium sarcochroum]
MSDDNCLGRWVNPDDEEADVGFGHLRYEGRSPCPVTVWFQILRDVHVVNKDYMFVIVRPAPEEMVITEALKRCRANGSSCDNVTLQTYSSFLEFIRTLRDEGQFLKLPHGRIVVLFSVEPEMSASCALALLAATHWAIEMARDTQTRMLTISASEVDRAYERLLTHYGMPEPEIFFSTADSREETERVRHIHVESMTEIKNAVLKKVKNKRGSQIIIAFPTWDVFGRRDLDSDQWDIVIIDSPKSSAALVDACTATEGKNTLLCLDHGVRSPVPLSGYDHIHLICNHASERKVYDTTLGQVAHVRLVHSVQERLEEYSWAFRTETPAKSITVYRDGPYNKKSWLRDGPEFRRQRVWNTHLGGFLALVASMEDWGLNAAKVASCFVPEGLMSSFMTTAQRLRHQGILKPNVDSRLTMNLQGLELAVFEAALPILNFDHRLAYLVAQYTDLPVVRQTKLQLASLLSVDISELFDFQNHNPEFSGDDRDVIISACRGYSKPLAEQGAMWVALGLWKSTLCDARPDHSISGNWYPVPGLLVKMDMTIATEALHTFQALDSALNKLMFTFTKSHKAEISMREHECEEIQKHLFKAYVSQLTLGVPMAKGGHYWKDLSSKRRISGLHSWMDTFVDVDKLRMQEEEFSACIFGIYHDLIRFNDGSTLFLDWTRIPDKVVTEWYEENNENGQLGINGILNVVGGVGPNYDDLDGNWKGSDE